MNVDELREQIQKKAKSFEEAELLDMIREIRGDPKSMKFFVTLNDVLALLENFACIPKKELQEKLRIAERESRFRVNWQHIEDLKEILGE